MPEADEPRCVTTKRGVFGPFSFLWRRLVSLSGPSCFPHGSANKERNLSWPQDVSELLQLPRFAKPYHVFTRIACWNFGTRASQRFSTDLAAAALVVQSSLNVML